MDFFIIADCDSETIICDISERQFAEFAFKKGVSDLEYNIFRMENKMIELTQRHSESLSESILIVENEERGRVLKFKLTYDSDNDFEFNSDTYNWRQIPDIIKTDGVIDKPTIDLTVDFDFAKFLVEIEWKQLDAYRFIKDGCVLSIHQHDKTISLLYVNGSVCFRDAKMPQNQIQTKALLAFFNFL